MCVRIRVWEREKKNEKEKFVFLLLFFLFKIEKKSSRWEGERAKEERENLKIKVFNDTVIIVVVVDGASHLKKFIASSSFSFRRCVLRTLYRKTLKNFKIIIIKIKNRVCVCVCVCVCVYVLRTNWHYIINIKQNKNKKVRRDDSERVSEWVSFSFLVVVSNLPVENACLFAYVTKRKQKRERERKKERRKKNRIRKQCHQTLRCVRAHSIKTTAICRYTHLLLYMRTPSGIWNEATRLGLFSLFSKKKKKEIKRVHRVWWWLCVIWSEALLLLSKQERTVFSFFICPVSRARSLFLFLSFL